MANRWCDGLGRYGGQIARMLEGASNQAWAEVASPVDNFSLSTANPRTGSHCLRMGNAIAGFTARRVIGSPANEVFFGFAFDPSALPSIEPVIPGSNGWRGIMLAGFRNVANEQGVSFWLGTDGGIVAYTRGEPGTNAVMQGTLLERSDPAIGAGAYNHIEFYVKAGQSDGALEVRVNEVTVLNLTGVNTDHYNSGAFNQVAILSGVGATPVTDFADFYVNDTIDDGSGCNTWIGDCKVESLMVSGDTAQADFALSTGSSGFDLLDDRPPNDATFIFSSTPAQSNFDFVNPNTETTEILTVRPFDRAFKDDAGTALIAPSMISNGDKATVTPQPITTVPAYYDSNCPLDPDTNAPWTVSGLSAALRAVERTS